MTESCLKSCEIPLPFYSVILLENQNQGRQQGNEQGLHKWVFLFSLHFNLLLFSDSAPSPSLCMPVPFRVHLTFQKVLRAFAALQ